MSKTLLVLQHVPFEGPASIRAWAAQRGFELQTICCPTQNEYPDVEQFAGFIIMGGPMGVNDELPWLQPEKKFIKQLIASGKPILGICLGAQLLADSLGASVQKHHKKEIGWFPAETIVRDHWLSKLLPDQFTPLHWHGDTFDIPRNATHICRSQICENQAFAVGEKIIGLQFHLEFDTSTATRVGEACADEIAVTGPSVQSLETICADKARFSEANQLMFTLLDQLFSKAS